MQYVLRPNIHMTALELWPYYTQEVLTEGPTYEPDLWVVRNEENGKPDPATPRDQIKEGLGYSLITLTENTLNRVPRNYHRGNRGKMNHFLLNWFSPPFKKGYNEKII
eukprot:sb/3477557/